MTREQLTAVLETMTGQLNAALPQQLRQLESARTRMAASLVRSSRSDTDNGLEQIFANSDLYARDRISADHLARISHIAGNVLERNQPATDDDDEEQFFIRSTPVINPLLAGSMPDWASGAKPRETVGPFLNNEGREIWIDFYRIQKLVVLYIGTQPAILFRASFPWRLIPQPQDVATEYRVVAGSVWINTRFFVPTATANQFAGLQVSEGIIRLSHAPVLQQNKLTISPATTITASLSLVQGTDDFAGNTNSHGRDAREAQYAMPDKTEFIIRNGKLDFVSIAAASATIFGQPLSFTFNPQQAITFSITSGRLLIPWTVDTDRFAMKNVVSPWVILDDGAFISTASWSLPIAQINVASPIVVNGNGGAWIELKNGITAEWEGLENDEARLVKPVIHGKPGEIDMLDTAASLLGASQHFDLWQDAGQSSPCTTRILYRDEASFLYIIRSHGVEMLIATGDVTIHADRPVKVDGEPFRIHTISANVLLAAADDKRNVYLLQDTIEEQPTVAGAAAPRIRRQSIAMENALFTVSPVAGFVLFGEADEAWEKITRANLFLTFQLFSYLPTLPDPYVANLGKWKAIFERLQRGGKLESGIILIGAVRYVQLENNTDQVDVGFYFGGQELPNFMQLPEQPANPTPAEQPRPQPAPGIRNKRALVFGRLNNSRRLTVRDMIGRFEPGVQIITPESKPTIDPTAAKTMLESASAAGNIRAVRQNLEANWEKAFGLSDHFSLLDVSSNANQLGVSFGTNLTLIRTGDVRRNNDGESATVTATNNGAFPFIVEGMQVKLPASNVRAFTLPLMAWEPEINLTKPDRADPENPSSAKLPMDPEEGFMYYANDGGPSRFWNNNTAPVPLAPIPMIDELVEDYKQRPTNYTIAAISLPFGMRGLAYIGRGLGQTISPEIKNIQPKFRREPDGSHRLTGGIQLRLLAGDYGKKSGPPQDHDSPLFPGYTMQFNNALNWIGQPSGASNLGDRVTTLFNSEFLYAPLNNSTEIGLSRGVPVSRMDITGYGANMFSNWISPTAAIAQTSQARFDVLMGRTGHEVIQVKSILYPWGIRVVRTITVFRTGAGLVFRTDSGWKAESDGKFDFAYKYDKITNPAADPADFEYAPEENKRPYEYHPGVIRGLYNIRNIKDAPSVREFTSKNVINPGDIYLYGVLGKELKREGTVLEEQVICGGVYFDADIEIENIVQGSIDGTKEVDLGGGKKTKYGRVASKKILGYVQLAPQGKPLTPQQLKAVLDLQNGSIGAEVDCEVNVSNSNQQMHINRIDVSASVGETGNDPVFVLAARGQVYLPKDGSWGLVQHNAGTGEVIPLPLDVTVPLIRKGKWVKEDVIDKTAVVAELARIAHPMELLRAPATGTINFGFLQTTGTQKALFLTPAYGIDVRKLLSKTPPVFADAYRLMTGNSIFPNIGNAIDNFGKAMPMDKVMEGANAVKAFADSAWNDGGAKALELLDVLAEKTGEAVTKQGMKLVQKMDGAIDKALEFAIPQLSDPIYLVQTDALKIYIEYKATPKNGTNKPGKLDFNIDSFTGAVDEQWRSRMNNLAMVVDLSEMKRIMTIKGNFDSKKGKESNYEGGDDLTSDLPTPEIEFSDALKPVIDILEVLSKLSTGDYAGAMKKGLKIAMSNSGEIWEYKFEATKEIPLVRFPPTDELYNSAQTPLKLEASMALGVYFNAALKVTTEPGQLLPTAGAFVKFHGGLSVMCVSVGVGTIYAVGSVDVKLSADTKVGPAVDLKFGFGVQLVVSLPVIGSVSVTYMVGVEMHADKTKIIVAALMLFRGQASLIGGLVCVTITIEAKGIIEREIGSDETNCSAQVTFALDISIFLVIDISFSKTWGETRQIA